MKTPKNIGLVLSGGGFKGVAHIGAIQAIEESGFIPQFISGASAGAIVGSLYAAKYTTEEIKSVFAKTSLFKFNRFTRKKAGFLDTEKFYDDLITFFPENSFESLDKKLFVTTTNLVEGVTKVFNAGQLIKPLLASAAFPGVFTPIMIDDQLYADGGILDNFPITPIREHCDFIIGIDVLPIKKPKITDFKHSYNVMQRAYYLRAMTNSETKFKECDIIIQPKDLVNHGIFTASNLDKVYQLGYQEAKLQLEKYLKANQK
ncbi:patatin-like phospholipase family protein [Aquimarina sp. 2201CG5-10]|uniref:patatin-like phospholipase family protein n=1 Tax=Aquimarina callyspongiae TaxID=3098150 RepID=UPI002AB52169|nr:patatin-like phospholipase family protein [Aquimarina sp. 2201CG5-10]MDY8134904.1 patatin-like phospholipase family protein [Aquimarina sp. 2201CG5-10]